jgi:6-phosphogluconolactonase
MSPPHRRRIEVSLIRFAGGSVYRCTSQLMPALAFPFLAVCWLLVGTLLPAAETPDPSMPRSFVYVSGYAPTISCFVFDPTTGGLTASSSSPGGTNPSFLAWAPDHRTLYALNESGKEGRVRAFRVNPADGALTPLSDAPSGGGGPCHLAVHASGKWLFVAHYGSGHVAVLPLAPDGAVGAPVDIQLAGSHAHMALSDHSGRFLFVPCLGSDHLAIYDVDAATGHLTAHTPATVALPKGAGPRHLAFHPSGRMAYVLNELASTLTSFTYDAATASFGEPQTVSTLPAGFSAKNSTAHVRVAPDGLTLYASNRGHDSLASFPLDPATLRPGTPTWETGGGDIRIPRHFTLSADGSLALVTSQGADRLTVFRTATGGAWTRLVSLPVTKGPSFVGIMPAP